MVSGPQLVMALEFFHVLISINYVYNFEYSIRSSWFYTDLFNSPQDANVPTLEDWVFNYGLNDQVWVLNSNFK